MAAVTINGSINGIPLSFLASYSQQAGLAASIFAASGAVISNGGFLTSNNTIDLGGPGSVLTGTAAFGTGPGTAAAMVALGANGTQGEQYYTGTSADSSVTAADNSNSTIVNDNPFGNLVAVTGAGPNVLAGFEGGNTFTTGPGGNDQVILDGATNSLTSNGSDAVLVGGPSTITAGATGVDSVLMTAGTTLAFINGSNTATTDSITGAANATINLAGTGNTSVTSGSGPETFFVDTSAGNTTLNGNLQTTDTFEFVKNASVTGATATGMVTVNNFAAGDAVDVHNYGSYGVTAAAGNPSGSVLVLSDGSKVTFSNVSVATLQATVKPV